MRKFRPEGAVRLALVLEVEPAKFSDRDFPDVGPARTHPAEWCAYFKGCLSDGGFPGIEPIAPGSNFVPMTELRKGTLLQHLVREHLGSIEVVGDEQELNLEFVADLRARLGPLRGGYALLDDQRLLIEPSCCGDLGDLAGWNAALEGKPASGRIWIGHPELQVAFDDGTVVLQETWESVAPPDFLHLVTVPVRQLEAAVAVAEQERQAFEDLVRETLGRMPPFAAHARQIAPVLAGSAA